MIDKIFDLGETDGARGHGAPGGRGGAPRHRLARRRGPPHPGARLLAHPGLHRPRVQHGRAWSPPWISCGRGADARTSARSCGPPPTSRRPSASTTSCARCRRTAIQLAVVVDEYGGSGRHRHRRGHRRGDRGRDPGRARPHPRHGGAPARRQLPGGRPGEHRRGQRGAGLGPAQGRLRDGGRPRAGHRSTASPRSGEVFRVGRYTFTVLEADKRRVLTVRITPPVKKAARQARTGARVTIDGRDVTRSSRASTKARQFDERARRSRTAN